MLQSPVGLCGPMPAQSKIPCTVIRSDIFRLNAIKNLKDYVQPALFREDDYRKYTVRVLAASRKAVLYSLHALDRGKLVMLYHSVSGILTLHTYDV